MQKQQKSGTTGVGKLIKTDAGSLGWLAKRKITFALGTGKNPAGKTSQKLMTGTCRVATKRCLGTSKSFRVEKKPRKNPLNRLQGYIYNNKYYII